MIYDKVLKSKNICLRMVELSDCNSSYCNWLNDKDVNQYLETRWTEQSIEKIKEFVTSIRDSSHSYLFAIICEDNHVGNIKIGPIHHIYKHADISYFIGNKAYWGKGIATEAVKLVVEFGFKILKLHKIEAGAFEQNVGSQHVLLKNNFTREAVLKDQVFLTDESNYCDVYRYSLVNNGDVSYE